MRAMRKKAKHIHASAVDLLLIRYEISTGVNADIAKSRQEK